MDLLWVLIVGGLIGWLSGNLIGWDVPSGVLGNIIAGFIGSWLGTELLGPRGPVIGGFILFQPSLARLLPCSSSSLWHAAEPSEDVNKKRWKPIPSFIRYFYKDAVRA